MFWPWSHRRQGHKDAALYAIERLAQDSERRHRETLSCLAYINTTRLCRLEREIAALRHELASITAHPEPAA